MLSVKEWLKLRQNEIKAQFSPLFEEDDNRVSSVVRLKDYLIFRQEDTVYWENKKYILWSFNEDHINVKLFYDEGFMTAQINELERYNA